MTLLIIPSNTLTGGGYAVDNSLRFNSGSSDYLSKEHGGADGNRKVWTFSAWVKRSELGVVQGIFSAGENNSAEGKLYFDANDFLVLTQDYQQGGSNEVDGVFRDTNAWYHIIWSCDVTQASNIDRWRIYVNGVQRTITGNPAITNADSEINHWSVQDHWIGGIARVQQSGNPLTPFDGYMAETYFIDGQSLTPTDFGEFDEDSGVWKPIAYAGSYGTNGFFLEFQDSGALGTDSSGNANTFTVNNLTSIDQTTDTPTNNFCTMNPLDNFYAGGTFTEGSLQVTSVNAGYTYNTSTIGVSSGKFYWECKWSAQPTGSSNQVLIGIAKRPVPSASTWLGSQAYTYGYQGSDGHVKVSNGNAVGSVATTYSIGDIISVALDLDNLKIHFAKNGVWTNSSVPASNSGGVTITAPDSTSGDSGFYFPSFGDGNSSLQETGQFNFGNAPYTITSGNADANSIGNFEYAVPTGYLSLCTKNLSQVNS